MKGVTNNIAPTITSHNNNATTTVLQPSIDTSSSIVCNIKKNCNQLAKQIGVMKKDPKSYTNDFLLKEAQCMKEISLDLQQYCSELFKENQKSQAAANSATYTKPVKQKKWQCKICHKAYVAMNLLTQHTHNVHDKERFPCTFEGCSKTFTTDNGVKTHVKCHTAAKTKMCNKCCCTFLNESELKAHMLTHYEK